MLKLITFMGTGPYQQSTYAWNDKTATTGFFSEALLQWSMGIDKTLVLLTQDARQNNNWQVFSQRMQEQGLYLPDNMQSAIVPIDIPSGKNERELWQIFDILVQHLEEGDEIIFDITHAFRSLPVLSLLAFIFIRTIRNVTIKHIVYGAFEGKDPETNITPVFDLSPFIGLLDWSQAAQQFMETGISRQIGDMLNLFQRSIHTNPLLKATLEVIPKQLQSTGSSLVAMSNALTLTQPRALSDAVKQFNTKTESASEEAKVLLKPYALIQEKIAESYQSYQQLDLTSLKQLIQDYLTHQQYVQAITLAREWLVCLVCDWLTGKMDPERPVRDEMETIINGWAAESAKKDLSLVAQESIEKYKPEQVIVFKADLVTTWNKVSQIRNDIAHCSMGRHKEIGTPNGMVKSIKEACALLEQLPLPESFHNA